MNGKLAVVTGGSGALGRAIIAALKQAGANALSLDVTDDADIRCDVRDDASVARAIASLDRVDIAVHAAGIARDAVVWKVSVEDWDAVQSVNLRGAFLLIRHVIPKMRADGGRIVLIGSINGSRGKFGTSAYSASKAGLLGLARSVSRETGRFGICVNVVEPGWVRTPLTEKYPVAARESAVAETLLGELVEPDDVASAVIYLCGARHVTGQILRVDSGQYL